MIKVLFAQGSYGNYFTRCLYNYTDLRSGTFTPFNFDQHGSSHQHRQDNIAQTKINASHLKPLTKIDSTDTVITLLPNNKHNLDYYNNQFFKQQQAELISYILNHFSQEEVNSKLIACWNFPGPFDNNVPPWILREWCSFWITECWNNVYNRENYLAIANSIQIEITDLLDQFDQTFTDIVNKLGLTINVDQDTIHNTHNTFLSLQRFHNSQINCNQWVNTTVNTSIDLLINTQTIFDEAYIQYLLRQQGYEIKCDGLDKFPTTTSCLKKIIYKI
jgi:hypothetical protein